MTPTRQAEEGVELAHPLRVALGQVVVDRDHVNAAAGKRIQIHRQGGDQRFTFTGLHFGDLALMQNDAADELHVEVPHLAARASRPRGPRRRPRAEVRRGRPSAPRSFSSASSMASTRSRMRWRNSSVLARSCSSVSCFIAGSSALTCSTSGIMRLISRSLLVPKTLATTLLINAVSLAQRLGWSLSREQKFAPDTLHPIKRLPHWMPGG